MRGTKAPSTFVDGIPTYRSMFASQQAEDACRTALPVAQEIASLAKVEASRLSKLDDPLLSVCWNYLDDLAVVERLPRTVLRDSAARVKQCAIELQTAIQANPAGDLSRHFDRLNAPDQHWAELKKYLNALIATCNFRLPHEAEDGRVIDPPRGESGRRNTMHIKRAVADLSALWVELSGEPFRRNLEIAARPDGTTEFAHHGPNFVTRVLLAIDPNLKFKEIAAALKRGAVKAK